MQGLGFSPQHHHNKVNEESKDLYWGMVVPASNPRTQEDETREYHKLEPVNGSCAIRPCTPEAFLWEKPQMEHSIQNRAKFVVRDQKEQAGGTMELEVKM